MADYVSKKRAANFEVPRVKNYISRLCTNPLETPCLGTQYPSKVKNT